MDPASRDCDRPQVVLSSYMVSSGSGIRAAHFELLRFELTRADRMPCCGFGQRSLLWRAPPLDARRGDLSRLRHRLTNMRYKPEYSCTLSMICVPTYGASNTARRDAVVCQVEVRACASSRSICSMPSLSVRRRRSSTGGGPALWSPAAAGVRRKRLAWTRTYTSTARSTEVLAPLVQPEIVKTGSLRARGAAFFLQYA